MANSNIKKLESGRADFAYKCAEEALKFSSQKVNNNFFQKFFKDKYFEKEKKNENPEEEENRKQKNQMIEKDISHFLSSEKDENYKWEFPKNEEKFKKDKEKFAKEYQGNIKKVPMHIKTNGLGASCAFMLSKAKKENNPWQLVYQQLQKWFLEDNKFCKHKPEGEKEIILDGKNTDLVKFLVQIDSSHYRAMTVEALALFNWLRRFAEGLIEGEEE